MVLPAFDRFVVEVFKEDATGRGPAAGRGWAALSMLFWGHLLFDVKGPRDQAASGQAELSDALRNTENRLGNKSRLMIEFAARATWRQLGGMIRS